MATGRKDSIAGNVDIPDLDLPTSAPHSAGPPAPPVAPTPASVPKAAADTSGAQDYFGAGTFDADQFGEGDGLDLALDAGGADAAPAEPSAGSADYFGSGTFGSDDFDDDFDALEGSTAAAAARAAPKIHDDRRWPTGKTPESSAIQIDAVEVAIAADYGDAPSNPAVAPAYTWRVWSRQRVLKEDVRRRTQQLEKEEAARDELLVAMVEGLRPVLEQNNETARLLGPVVEMEKLGEQRRGALAGTNAEYDHKSKAVEQKLAQIDAATKTKQAALTECDAELSARQKAFQREDVKNKRLYIELRAIVNASEQQGGSMSRDQAQKAQQLEAQIAQLKPGLEALAGHVKAAQAKVTAARGEVTKLRKARSDVDRQQKALDAQFQKQIGARAEGVNEAETAKVAALVEVAQYALAMKGRIEIPDDNLDALVKVEDRIAARAEDLEKYLRALDSYDRDGFKQGGIVAGVAAGVVLLLLVVLSLT